MFSPKITRKRQAEKKLTIPQLDGAHDDIKKTSSSRTTRKNKESKRRGSDENSDSDFEPSSSEKKKRPTPVQNLKIKSKKSSNPLDRVKRIDRRVFSTDEEDNENAAMNTSISNKKAMNFWPEVYCEKEKKWIAVDLVKAKVNAVQNISVSVSCSSLTVFTE